MVGRRALIFDRQCGTVQDLLGICHDGVVAQQTLAELLVAQDAELSPGARLAAEAIRQRYVSHSEEALNELPSEVRKLTERLWRRLIIACRRRFG